MFLKAIRMKENPPEGYPYELPLIQTFSEQKEITFEQPITFFAGENGSGKSTLLEAIAVAVGINPEGGSKYMVFSTFDSHSSLHEQLTLVRSGMIPTTSFFLRAENYYNFASEIEALKVATSYGERSLHAMSHGEGMLSIISQRFTEKGFYILDEPESGLSVSRQMTLLKEVVALSQQGCQFLIATHSPILLAAPDATIYDVSEGELTKIAYQESRAFLDMQLFLNNPERMLHYLLDDT